MSLFNLITEQNIVSEQKLKKAPDAEYLFEYCKTVAEQGNKFALYNLGQMYLHGVGTEKNIKLASRCYIRASKDNTGALIKLGILFREKETSYTGEVEYKESNEMFFQAAEKDNYYGFYQLGKSYMLGLGFPKNMEQAVEWYKKAGERHHSYALLYLGEIYEGIHTDDTNKIELDNLAAANYYLAAAANDNYQGFKRLIDMLCKGNKLDNVDNIIQIIKNDSLVERLEKYIDDHVSDYYCETKNPKLLVALFEIHGINEHVHDILERIYDDNLGFVIDIWKENKGESDISTVLQGLVPQDT